jgi:hypothetical protein
MMIRPLLATTPRVALGSSSTLFIHHQNSFSPIMLGMRTFSSSSSSSSATSTGNNNNNTPADGEKLKK